MLATFVLALTLAAASVSAADSTRTPMPEMIARSTAVSTHRLVMPYIDSDLQNRWWDYGGDTIINTNKHIRLTQDRKSERGFIWSRLPLNSDNFQVTFEFKVDGKGMSTYGDGFAMWLTSERAVNGPVFGNQDYFNGLGVFFDTYANSRHGYSFPRITAMLGDGKTQYDLEGDNAAHELAGCSRNFRRKQIPTRARLTYVKGKGVTLETQFESVDKWETCFTTEPVTLPEKVYLGFTALTGDVADNHDIVSVETQTIVLKDQYRNQGGAAVGAGAHGKQQATFDKQRAPRAAKSGGGGWFLWILKLIGIVAFLAFAFAAYRTWSAQQTKRPQYF